VRYRETCSTNRDLFKHSLWYGNLAKKMAKQLKIAERGQIYERTGIGDDQVLPDLASSFEFIDGLGVRFPVFRSVDDVRDAAVL